MSQGNLSRLSLQASPGNVPSNLLSTANDGASPTCARTVKDETGPSESNPAESKGRKSITANACTNSKKARSKCDGCQPICQRCRSRPVPRPCEYVLHTKALKEQLMREIRHLQAENRSLTRRNTFLGNMLGYKSDTMEGILQSLEDYEPGGEVVSRLVGGQNTLSNSGWVAQAPASGGALPATPQQLDQAIDSLPLHLDLNAETLSWMAMNLQDPRCQMGANLE
ncbi:hypothetical protein XPA_003963 [Xanthoria parietina]